MKDIKPIYVNRQNKYHLYTSTIASEPRRYECCYRDAGVQHSSPREVVCTCRNVVPVLRRPQEVRYCSHPPIHTYYGSRSFTDIGVGSVKPLQRKKVRRIYLPETDDRGVGSSDLSPLFTRKTKPYKTNHYYDHKNTSTRGFGGTDDAVAVINEKLSPITNTQSGATSPEATIIQNKVNNVDFGINTQEKTLASISTQIDDETRADNIKIEVRTVEVSFEHVKEPVKQHKKSNPKIIAPGGDREKRVSKRAQEAERVYSSDSLVQHVHNLENPSEDKHSHADVMENKLEREYRRMFSTKSKESKDHRVDVERTSATLKSTSLLRRRFEALRRGLAKKEDSKRNEVIPDKEYSNVSVLSKRDVSIASDPPSLESRSYSDIKLNSPYPNPAQITPFEANKTGKIEEDSSYQGAEGMFKLWGKKFNLEDDEMPQSSKFQDRNEGANKKSGKKFFFFKKKNSKEPKELFKKGVTTGRCEVGDGLMIKIGAAHTKPRPTKKKETKIVESITPTDPMADQYEEIFRKAWLQKFLAQTIESRNSVKVRWNNNAYATSSSTIFEIMENVYKDTGIVFRSKSEITAGEPSFYKSAVKQRVNFVQDIQAWMIPKLIPDKITQVNFNNDNDEEGPDKNKIQVRISDQKWFIEKSKAFAQKIEVVLHSQNIVHKACENPSSEYLTINIPKGFFSDSGTDSGGQDHTSNEEVYKIVEYELPENKPNYEIGDHVKDIKLTVSLKDSRNFESNIVETVIKRPSKQRDVVIQGSRVSIPTRCNVIGVGIITQPDMNRVRKPILKIQDEYSDDESDHSPRTRVKSKFAETYLQDYYRQWTPLGIDCFSWCFSDTQVQCCSEDSEDSVTNQGDCTKSCPNIYDSFMTSTVMSSCGTSCCNPCGPMPLCDPWYNVKPSILAKVKKKFRELQPNEPCSEEKRVFPKDSLEVFRRRKLYAMSNKSKWCDNPSDKPCSVPSTESKCAQDTSPTCPKKSCWKPTPQGTKTKICTKHVYIPDCETLNDSLCKQWESKRQSGILAFKGAAKCEMCEKRGTQCSKHAALNCAPPCEIPPANRPCMDEPPPIVECKAKNALKPSLISLKIFGRGSPPRSPKASSTAVCGPKPPPPPPACPPPSSPPKPPPLCPLAPQDDPVCYPRECHPFPPAPPCSKPPPPCPKTPTCPKPPPACPTPPPPCPKPPPACPMPPPPCPKPPPACPAPPPPCLKPPPACPKPPLPCPKPPPACPAQPPPCPKPPPACPAPPPSCPDPPPDPYAPCPFRTPPKPLSPKPCPTPPPSCPAHPPPPCPVHPPPCPVPPILCPAHQPPPPCPAHPPPPQSCPDPPPTCPYYSSPTCPNHPPSTCPYHPPPTCPNHPPTYPNYPPTCPNHPPPCPIPHPPPPCPKRPPDCLAPPPCPKPPPECPASPPPCPSPPPPCPGPKRKGKSKKPKREKRDKCVAPGKPPCGSPEISGIRLQKGYIPPPTRGAPRIPCNDPPPSCGSPPPPCEFPPPPCEFPPPHCKMPPLPCKGPPPDCKIPSPPSSSCESSPSGSSSSSCSSSQKSNKKNKKNMCSKPPCSPKRPCSPIPDCFPKPTCSDKPSPCATPPKKKRPKYVVPQPVVHAPPPSSSFEKKPCTSHPKCKRKNSCQGCKKTASPMFPWPTENQNSNQCSVKSFNMSLGGTSMTSQVQDNRSNDMCQQCPSKTSCITLPKTPPKVPPSGIFLKMRPGRNCPGESPQQDFVAKHCTAINKDDDIVINIKKTTDSTEEIRDGYNIKVQDFDGNTLYERREYTNNSDNMKCIQQKRHSVLNEMYKNSNVHVVSTSRQVQKVECDEESNDVGDAKSEASIANLIEINFKLKVTQGEKTTEYNLGTDDVSDKSKYSANNQIGQTPQDVFVLKDAAEQCADDNNDKNDINIKIVIKNYKQKNKNQPTSAPFSESTVIRKFQTVSTGYNAGDSNEDNIYSINRPADLETTTDTSNTKLETRNTKAKEERMNVASMHAMPLRTIKSPEPNIDPRRNENTKDIQNYICTENSAFSRKMLSRSSSLVEQDINKESDKDDTTSHSLVVPATVLTRDEKKSLLKKVMEKVKRKNTKEKMNQFKEVLNMILTDSDQEEKNFNNKVREMTYTAFKPRKSTGSMNNYYKTESSLTSPEASEVNPNMNYPTEIVSESSVRDSDESYDDDKPGTCLCSTFAARLNIGSITGGGCCCRTPAKIDAETFCDLRTEEDFLLLNYKTIEYIDVETQNSKYFCNSNNVSVHSKAVSSTFGANGFKGEVFEVFKTQSVEKDTRDFAVSVHHRVPSVACQYKKVNRSTTLGISDEDKVYIMNTKPTSVAVTADMSNEEKNDDDEKRRRKMLTEYQRVTDIWQCYETKKAVLEIYAEKTRSDEGGHFVAKLPKFVYEKESDIERNYGKYVQSLYQGIKNSRVF